MQHTDAIRRRLAQIHDEHVTAEDADALRRRLLAIGRERRQPAAEQAR